MLNRGSHCTRTRWWCSHCTRTRWWCPHCTRTRWWCSHCTRTRWWCSHCTRTRWWCSHCTRTRWWCSHCTRTRCLVWFFKALLHCPTVQSQIYYFKGAIESYHTEFCIYWLSCFKWLLFKFASSRKTGEMTTSKQNPRIHMKQHCSSFYMSYFPLKRTKGSPFMQKFNENNIFSPSKMPLFKIVILLQLVTMIQLDTGLMTSTHLFLKLSWRTL